MKEDITAGEIWKLQEQMEKSAASILGHMLFEFARLDTATGMCVSWVDEGRQLEAMTARAMALSFHKRLEFLSEWVGRNLPADSDGHQAYVAWLVAADAVRLKRNRLVHGRWWVDPYQDHVVNVTGLPNSPEQAEHRYTLADLQGVLDEMKRLQSRLYDLRQKWPL
jgi:hypothetical protein